MTWAILIGAGLLEVVWALALKRADGFTRLWPSIVGVTAAAASFVMLAVALKSLPVGVAYAAWVGSGCSAWRSSAWWRWARAPRCHASPSWGRYIERAFEPVLWRDPEP